MKLFKKNFNVLISFLLLSSLCSCITQRENNESKKDRAFPIGFYCSSNFSFWNPDRKIHKDAFGEKDVKLWSDAGITVTMSPQYREMENGKYPTQENLKKMRALLGLAKKYGVKIILQDPRCISFGAVNYENPSFQYAKPGTKRFAAGVKEAVKEFGENPAVWGFYIGDEPHGKTINYFLKAYREVKKAAPQFTPYVNHLPAYAWELPQFANIKKESGNWNKYIDMWIKKTDLGLISYDCYTQMLPGISGWDKYFLSLSTASKASTENGIPFWNMILSSGHYNFRVPSESDIRWQFNTSIAYGAKGIMYYGWYSSWLENNYRAPIDLSGKPTPVYYSIRRVNNEFQARYAPLFLSLKFKKAMQFGKVFGDCEKFVPDNTISKITSTKDRPLIVSYFDDDKKNPYIAVVNNNVDENTFVKISLSSKIEKVWQHKWNDHELLVKNKDWDGNEGMQMKDNAKSQLILNFWLAPGQMEVFRIKNN